MTLRANAVRILTDDTANHAEPSHRERAGRRKASSPGNWRVSNDGRMRFHGQAKKGRVSAAVNDSMDARHAVSELSKALNEYVKAQDHEIGSRDRKLIERAAVDRVSLAGRFVDVILERRGRL